MGQVEQKFPRRFVKLLEEMAELKVQENSGRFCKKNVAECSCGIAGSGLFRIFLEGAMGLRNVELLRAYTHGIMFMLCCV